MDTLHKSELWLKPHQYSTSVVPREGRDTIAVVKLLPVSGSIRLELFPAGLVSGNALSRERRKSERRLSRGSQMQWSSCQMISSSELKLFNSIGSGAYGKVMLPIPLAAGPV